MSRSKQIDMSEIRLVADLRIGCIHLKKAHTLPLSETFVDLAANEISITFWGDTPEPWDGTSLVSIRMFRLPKGRGEFQRQIDWFSNKRKQRARLPDGVPFDSTTMAIRSAPASWQHEAFARSGRDFIHIYQTKRNGLLMRLVGHAGTILDNPLLKRVNQNLRIVEDQWIVAFPETEVRRRSRSKVWESPLEPGVVIERDNAIARAREFLALSRNRKPSAIVDAIQHAIDEIRARKRLSATEREQLAIDLGALWGDALHNATQWDWCAVHPNNSETVYALCHPSRSHAVDPISVIHSLLSSKRGANNSALLFNMIAANELPESPPSSYTWLS